MKAIQIIMRLIEGVIWAFSILTFVVLISSKQILDGILELFEVVGLMMSLSNLGFVIGLIVLAVTFKKTSVKFKLQHFITLVVSLGAFYAIVFGTLGLRNFILNIFS